MAAAAHFSFQWRAGTRRRHSPQFQRKAWADITDRCHFGVLCRADSLAVEVAAVLMAEFRSNPVDIPAAKLARLDSLLSRFGMTPADRSKVSSSKRKTENRFSRNGNR